MAYLASVWLLIQVAATIFPYVGIDCWWVDYGMALALSVTGRNDEAGKPLEVFIEPRHDGPFQTAELYAFRDDINLALEWLENKSTTNATAVCMK